MNWDRRIYCHLKRRREELVRRLFNCMCAETDDSSVKSARFLHPNRTKRGSHTTSDTICSDRCSGCYDNTFSG